MERDNIWLFYSLEILMMYWGSKHPTQFNLDKHEKDFQKESGYSRKNKQNIPKKERKERQQVLSFGE